MTTEAKIGWIPSARDKSVAGARLRCYMPNQYLREAGWNSELFDDQHTGDYDVVVFQKIYDEAHIELAKSLRASGVRTVFDLCDNHFYNPDHLPHLTERAERLKQMLDSVDAITVCTPSLGDQLADWETIVIDDALDEFRVPPTSSGVFSRLLGRARRAPPLRLVWFGNAGLESPSFGLAHLPRILPLLEELRREVPLALTVVSNSEQAYRKVIAGHDLPSTYRRWSAPTFAREVAGHDVCVIPVELNPFTTCKTNNRVALSLRLGVPVIADPVPSFAELAPFILLDAWGTSLRRYAADPELRARHALEGGLHVDAVYTRARVVAQWSAAFEPLLDGRRAGAGSGRGPAIRQTFDRSRK